MMCIGTSKRSQLPIHIFKTRRAIERVRENLILSPDKEVISPLKERRSDQVIEDPVGIGIGLSTCCWIHRCDYGFLHWRVNGAITQLVSKFLVISTNFYVLFFFLSYKYSFLLGFQYTTLSIFRPPEFHLVSLHSIGLRFYHFWAWRIFFQILGSIWHCIGC